MKRRRLLFLAPLIAAGAVGLACAGHAAPRATETPSGRVAAPGGLATWVWDEATVQDAAARRRLLDFAQRRGIHTLFVHAGPGYDAAPGFAALAALVEGAGKQGASIVLVGGDPAWTLPDHRSEAAEFVARAGRLEARLATRGLPRAGRVLLDVEPYLRPEWRAAREQAVSSYVEFLRAARAAGRTASLEVWQTIPFWFPEVLVAGQPLTRVVLDESAGVVVMAYRNRTDDVRALAAPILEEGARRDRPVIVAVETMCIDPPRVTFCGQTGRQFGAALDGLEHSFRSAPAFAGLAVHKYASWATVEATP
ncbi:MAG TPA: hypothetical protein VGG65_05445 [Thermoanaerobaculia bacterium]